jgi:hypothetical protein
MTEDNEYLKSNQIDCYEQSIKILRHSIKNRGEIKEDTIPVIIALLDVTLAIYDFLLKDGRGETCDLCDEPAEYHQCQFHMNECLIGSSLKKRGEEK